MSQAFLTELPARSEAILKVVAHGWNTSDPPVRCAITSLEAPSAFMTARWLYPELEILVNEVPDPDPRIPFQSVTIVAWTYDGFDASLALPPPHDEFCAALAASIKTPFSLDGYADSAARIAREFSALMPCEQLGAMVFPPTCPQTEWPWEWIFRIQVMCALVLARTNLQQWDGSSPAKHIYDLCFGPVDWTTTAGLIALTDRARLDRDSRDEIRSTLFSLLKRPMSPVWYMCAYKPIWQLLQHFPGLDSDTRRTIESTVEKLDSEDEEA